MLNIILFGPPGAGKGTQAEKLIKKYNLVHLSTGDLLRSEIAQGSALGLEAKKLMDEGKLVPDNVVIGMIEHKVKNNPNAEGFIFDGFPRTEAQAEALDGLMNSLGKPILGLVSLEVDENELVRRLIERGKISGRSDDNEETIHKRLVEYENKTRAVAHYYSKHNKHYHVDGIGSMEDIFDRICKVIDGLAVGSK